MQLKSPFSSGSQVLAGLLLPAVVALSLSVFLLVRNAGGPLELAVLVATVVTLLLAMGAERLWPYRQEWNRAQGDLATDVSSAVVLVAMVDPLLKYLAPIVVVALYAHFNLSGLYATVLGQWPFLLQLFVVTLLIELGRYWAHRLHHQLPSLWWLHAMHHSSPRLYAFNNLRLHPLNYGVSFLVSVFPFILIGVPADVLLGYLAFTQPVVMLQHANLNARHGLLNYVFSTNELHRWHHSTKAGEANSNYGHALILWDQVFGTFRYCKGANAPESVGLFASSQARYPAGASYGAQLVSMFSRRCCVS